MAYRFYVETSLRKLFFIVLNVMIFSYGLTPIQGVLLTSYRVESSSSGDEIVSVADNGQLTLRAERVIDVRIFSSDRIAPGSEISFTNIVSSAGSDCNDLRRSSIFKLRSIDSQTALVTVVFSKSDAMLEGYLMFCFRSGPSGGNGTTGMPKGDWVHQGDSKWLTMLLFLDDNTELILIWVKSILVPVFLLLSALFSGLALNLLSLTRTELKVLRNQGTTEERRYARVVSPLRKRGNVLFCGLLLLNTLVNVVVAVLLHELIDFYSILAATLMIFFLGEIVPQSICSRFGLSFGNKMAWLTNIFLVLTLPFSYPLGKLLDLLLKDEVPAVYNRDRFQEMLSRSQKSGGSADPQVKEDGDGIKALRLSSRTVGDVMVKLEDAYMEEYDSVLTAEKVTEILKKGYTRIPVFEKERANIVALLHVRDLTLIDPEDRLTLKTVCKFYNRPVNFVFEDTKLNVMLEEFKKGQSHMAFVQRVNNEGPGDPYYETLGMITLEDVIEDIFHSDSVANRQLTNAIFDPNVHFHNNEMVNNMEKFKFNQYLTFNKTTSKSESGSGGGRGGGGGVAMENGGDDDGGGARTVDSLSPNLIEAVKQFLATLPPFRPDLISLNVLDRLLRQSTLVEAEGPVDSPPDAKSPISSSCAAETPSSLQTGVASSAAAGDHLVEKGKPLDSFILVLEGKVKVTIGAENLVFTEGPFSHYGLKSLLDILENGYNIESNRPAYVPDFGVRAATSTVALCVPSSVYVSSLQATQLQQLSNKPGSQVTLDFTGSQVDENSLAVVIAANDAAIIEANNVRNSYLNHQLLTYPCGIGFPGAGVFPPGNRDFFVDPGVGDYRDISPPGYPYHLGDDDLQRDPRGIWSDYAPPSPRGSDDKEETSQPTDVQSISQGARESPDARGGSGESIADGFHGDDEDDDDDDDDRTHC